MLRHIVLLELADDATPEQVDAIVDGLHGLRELEGIEALHAGRDLQLADGNATVGATIDFRDRDAWQAYQQHPAHRTLITEHIAPVLADRAAIQIEL